MAYNAPPPPPGPPGVAPPPPGAMPPEGIPPEGMSLEGLPPEGVEETKGPNKIVIYLAVAGGVILVAVVLLFLLSGGEEKPAATPTPPASPRPQAAGQPSPTGTAPTPAPSFDAGLNPDVNESYQQYSSRNPFRCTFACPTPAGATTTTGGTGSSPSPTGSPVSQGGRTSGTQEPVGSTSVTLVEITRVDGVSKAVVKVSGATHTVGVGETFAGSYKLTRISGSCASFVQGDSPFTLCTGQSVLK